MLADNSRRFQHNRLVEFAKAADARRAIAQLNDTDLQGRLIFVREVGYAPGFSISTSYPHISDGFAIVMPCCFCYSLLLLLLHLLLPLFLLLLLPLHRIVRQLGVVVVVQLPPLLDVELMLLRVLLLVGTSGGCA